MGRDVHRILAVDADPASIALLNELLNPATFDLVTAASAEQALKLLAEEKRPFDLMVIDRMLPGMNGAALLRRIRSFSRFKDVPAVMQTTFASPLQVREGLAAGAAYYLLKPLDADCLSAIIRGALNDVNERRSLMQSSISGSGKLHLLREGEFEFRTLGEAKSLALELSRICPEPDAAAIGLMELMVNAVEHGNLEISYDEKSSLIRANRWHAEVDRRLDLATYADRRARVRVTRTTNLLRFVVRDDGPGFCWERYLRFEPSRAFDPNGRGIALAREMAFSSLRYQDPGNVVTVEVPLKAAS